jgi:hypothetical protein
MTVRELEDLGLCEGFACGIEDRLRVNDHTQCLFIFSKYYILEMTYAVN